ncbi:hypothetical protein [Tateyamaria sp. Alg231-49]|uniref:hypothetical protein n=1 Tax=Tateyamaria sp. Alg231-49 TaxID=1922219 RepID=UPI00131EF7F5|nr:hypothetical protein [Tateyamaria sp. Alg231-49]
MMDAETKSILDALGQILKEERASTDKQIGAVAERIDTLDGNNLVKGAAMAVADSNLAALRTHAENVVLRRSKHLKGDLPAMVKAVFQ